VQLWNDLFRELELEMTMGQVKKIPPTNIEAAARNPYLWVKIGSKLIRSRMGIGYTSDLCEICYKTWPEEGEREGYWRGRRIGALRVGVRTFAILPTSSVDFKIMHVPK
jgi:hypothetical protein